MEFFSAAFEDTCFPCVGMDLFSSFYDTMDSSVQVDDSMDTFEYPAAQNRLPPFPVLLLLSFVVACMGTNVWKGNRLMLMRIYW